MQGLMQGHICDGHYTLSRRICMPAPGLRRINPYLRHLMFQFMHEKTDLRAFREYAKTYVGFNVYYPE